MMTMRTLPTSRMPIRWKMMMKKRKATRDTKDIAN